MTEVSDRMVANNNTVNWIPEGIGQGRFGEWLKNVQDWGLSRDRYWGTPLNVWECADCGKRDTIGSIAELRERGKMEDGSEVPEDIELHRPFVDGVVLTCPDCGKPMRRVPEVIDCWFDSGAMPFAQWHYPFENKEIFEENFPADFISEAVDQTRGWFYSLMAISTLLFDKAPYKNVIVLGLVLDEDGQKMSKSKGNAVDPMDALNKFGADAIRWYFYTNSQPWLPNRFHEGAVTEGQHKFMGTLWNTYAFYVLYAEIDQFDPTKYTLEYDKLSVMDKWVLSKLNTAVKEFDENLGAYKIPEAAAVISEFVDDLSNWYVRRCRERYWAKGMEQDKINAYMTLYTALETVIKVAAPMVPFITESIYQNLVRNVNESAPISVHLCDYPEVHEEFIDKDLEASMEEVLGIKTYGSAARNAVNIKNRQPVANLYIKAEKKLDDYFIDIIKDELNIKNIEFRDDVSEFSTYTFKPQLKTVGPKYGKIVNGIREYLANIPDGNAAYAELKEKGALSFTVDGTDVELAEEDLLIEVAQSEEYVTFGDNFVTVVLDTKLTPELIEEGYVREIISKVQSMRKEADFEVTDRIELYMSGSDKLSEIVVRNDDKIKSAVLADHIMIGKMAGFTKEWNINGEAVMLGVAR
jgi:isoleucyl-tRNA synthetase